MMSGSSRTFSNTDAGRRGARLAVRALVGTAAVALLAGAAAVPAFAIGANQDSVVANVGVNSTITLNVTTDSFALNGPPGATVAQTGAVTGLVTTNNATGYNIGVVAAAAALVGTGVGGNTDSIPIAALEVVNALGEYTSLSNSAPVITNTKSTRSALAGDSFSNNYRVTIPDVNSDNYSVTLNYTATALA